MRRKSLICSILSAALIFSLSCNLPFMVSKPAPSLPPTLAGHIATPPATGTEANPIVQSESSATPQPLVATVLASTHVATPADITASGTLNYDVDSSGTASEN